MPADASRRLATTVLGTGPRVVLVHGFTQTRRSFAACAEALAKRHEVVTVDLPDHGDSSDCHARDLDDAADLLAEAGGRASYVGYSLGGRVCLTLALAHRDLVESLVLVGATPGIAEEAARAERRAADEALAKRLDPGHGEGLSLEAFLQEWLAGPLFAHLSPEQADVASRLANTPAGLARSLRTAGTGTQVPSYGRLHELTMPVLLVAGGSDERFAQIAASMAAEIGERARAIVVSDCGHAVPFEAPAAFLAVLERFLPAPA